MLFKKERDKTYRFFLNEISQIKITKFRETNGK